MFSGPSMAAIAWCLGLVVLATLISLYWTFDGDRGCFWFVLLFLWRYTRFPVCLLGFVLYRPVSKAARPTYSSHKDVTIIMPTIDPRGHDFDECIRSVAATVPAKIIVVTAGEQLLRVTESVIAPYADMYQMTEFTVKSSDITSKREQVAVAIGFVTTPVTVLIDDHIFWKPEFLSSLLHAFEDPSVGFVATNKRVRRRDGLSLWNRCWNMLGAIYLERHNFEIRSTNAIDGGVFVVSGRTCAIRTSILQHETFIPGYLHEKFFLGKYGPLNADDDNYITRFVVRMGWDIKVHYSDQTCIETTVGVDSPVVKKFLDPLLMYLMTRTSWYKQADHAYVLLIALALWILLTKLVKVWPYYARHPQDIVFFPVYLLFAYFHSCIKLYALVTFWDCSWSGRNLKEAVAAVEPV
ncbi:hypothetical protein DL546_008094 [Coniochaeta pulveracea]|uniref:Glycosyltransferase 2-like domain-containing protein n=1 Tax=Coniochaeta pulveracea TaxID=177199 RepID=A0A420YL95_9PEZI|nr:hypothetical protein DL546_008094 [Coniochaeta pulveracea]